MTRIDTLLAAGPTLSVELFPPKTPEGLEQMRRTLEELAPLRLSFVSMTYGAGGSTRDLTRDLVVELNEREPMPVMPHLTCMGHTRAEIESLVDDYAASGIENLLALAGDPPADGSPVTGDFTHATELVEVARARASFGIGVAAFPESHPRSPDVASDRRHLAEKLSKADFGITQFFFDADPYLRMIDELAEFGCEAPVLPGIMPLLNTTTIRRFATVNGTTFPEELAARIDAAGSEEEVLEIAVDAAVRLCERLLASGAPGLHMYSLNRSHATLAIVDALGLSDPTRR